jgi:hypothetical protein
VTAPGVTFLISDGTYTEDSLDISTATSSASAPIVFKPDAGATVVINVTPPSSTYDFGIAIEETQYVTIDGSNDGSGSRDLTINALGTDGQKGVWISGASAYTTVKNCNINAGHDASSLTSSYICVDVRYTSGNNPDSALIENNLLKYAYTGVRIQGYSSSDQVESVVVKDNVVDSVAEAGIYSYYQNNSMFYDNDISLSLGYSGTIYGIYTGSYTSNIQIFRNKIHDINQLSTSSSTTYGMYLYASTTGGMNKIFNNFIYNINVDPAGTGSVYGIYHSTGNTTEADTVAYNSINLTGTSDGDRSTVAYYKSSSTGPIVVYNNIFQNTRTDGTAGNAAAIGITSSSVDITSNNNNLYVGTPDSMHHTGRVGSSYFDELADWQLETGTDQLSVVENSPFVSSDDLHIQTGVPTQLESAGTPIATITTDIDQDVRNAVTPDIGADEGDFLSLDLTPPDISYDPLPNSSSTTNVDLDATITDASGVQTGVYGPRLYYKKSTDPGYVYDDTPTIVGDVYSFVIDYTNVGGVTAGDTIHYYVAAQDIYENVGTNPVGGSGSNPPGTTPPDPDNYYVIVGSPLSGVYTVGLSAFSKAIGKNVYKEIRYRSVTRDLIQDIEPGTENKEIGQASKKENANSPIHNLVTRQEPYCVLMADGKVLKGTFYQTDDGRGIYPTITDAVNDLNLRGVDGPVTFQLVDTDYPNETYPILVGEVAGVSSTNTVTFKPGPGIITQIPGATDQPASTFQLTGADYVIIDGSNTENGTSQDLTINALTSDPALEFNDGADNNLIKNTNFTSLNTSTVSGTVYFGPVASGDYNIVDNCNIKSNDTSSTRNAIGVYMYSSNTSTGNQIVNCTVTGFNDYGIYLRGAPSHDHLVKGNTVDMLTPSDASTVAGIRLDGAAGTLVDGNYFLNINSTYSSPTAVEGIYYYGYSTPMNIIIQNNVVSLGDLTTAGTIRGLDYYAYSSCSVEMYFNTVYIGGIDVTSGSTYGLTKRISADSYKVYDNAVYNSRSNGTGTGTHYGVYISSTTATIFELNNNDYYTDGAGGVLGYYSGTQYTNISDWQTATGQDANSLSSDPQFVSSTDYRPATTSPLIGAGLTIAGITTDILGDLRNEPPTIGAYENGVVLTIAAPSNLIAVGDTDIVHLYWLDNSTNELGFVIERKLGDSLSVNPFEVLDTVAADVQSYDDTDVLPLTTYTYRLYGYNSETVSDYSNIAQATTLIPVELTSFTANVGESSVKLKWETATETNNSGFELQRKIEDTWVKVAFIKGKGTTTEKSDYSFVDDFKYQSVSGVISYRLKQIDMDGSFNYAGQIDVNVDFTPKEYTLYQNYPNPFNPSTRIKFALPFDSHVRISVYNILGQLVEVLLDEDKTVGYHDIQWGGFDNPSGMYIYTIQAKSLDGKKDYTSVKKMMLIK